MLKSVFEFGCSSDKVRKKLRTWKQCYIRKDLYVDRCIYSLEEIWLGSNWATLFFIYIIIPPPDLCKYICLKDFK
jgi:hypothetical protein